MPGLFLLMVFFAAAPHDADAFADLPDYCMKCHVMESAYEAWIHTGAHRRIKCVDCHLPNDNQVMHYIWKTIDGIKDAVAFHSGKVPEEIAISSHGRKVIQANCIRCHETAVTMIDKERECWGCHRRVTHKLTGTIETLQ
ncbi:MAG: cytochrome c nitrite reductase small subunit [Nitrospirota bacterium]